MIFWRNCRQDKQFAGRFVALSLDLNSNLDHVLAYE